MKKFIILLMLGVIISQALQSFGQNARISGHLSYLKDGDTVTVKVSKYFGASSFSFGGEFEKVYKAKVVNSTFKLNIPIEASYLYVSYLSSKMPNNVNQDTKWLSISDFFVEPKDDIKLMDEKGTLIYSGKGSDKWNIIDTIMHQKFRPSQTVGSSSAQMVKLDYLESKKNEISEEIYYLLKSDILCQKTYFGEFSYYNYSNKEESLIAKPTNYDNSIWDKNVTKEFLKKKEIQSTGWLSYNILLKFKVDSCYIPRKPFSILKCYNYLVEKFEGPLREYLTTILIYGNRFNGGINSDEFRICIDLAMSTVKNEDYRYVLQKVKSTALIGAPAYNFSLTDSKGKMRKLSDFKGKVVLIDFWYTGCGACAQVAQTMKKIEPQFDDKDVIFMTISIDKNRDLWLNSLAGNIYSTPSKQAVNLYTEGKGAKHPVIDNFGMTGSGYPVQVLIDRNGKMLAPPILPHIDQGKDLILKINAALNLLHKKK